MFAMRIKIQSTDTATDFFDRYNNDKRIKRKYELREEIIYSSQSLVEDMKSIIDKIVRIYEIEEV